MKIFIDTNIFLDLILKREDYQDATKILNSCDGALHKAVISDITLLNIDYIASKQVKNIKDFLILIIKKFEIVGANNEMFNSALNIQNKDLEDNVQYISAKEKGCDFIITNDKNFYKGDIEVINSKDFVDKYLGCQ